jgi:glutamine amidotransferase
MKIAIIDYGMGNLRSVYNAFELLGAEPIIEAEPANLDNYNRVVLPGVGAFGEAVKRLRITGWEEALNNIVLEKGMPFLGICLGMQLVAETGTEYGINRGLGWVKGSVDRLSSDAKDFRLPHIGWNTVEFAENTVLYKELGEKKDFYFVNSYALFPEDRTIISGTTEYFINFTASIEMNNIFATQFHPEKSHKAGIKVLENFMNWKG